MKRNLLLKTMLLLCALVVGISSSWATDVQISSFSAISGNIDSQISYAAYKGDGTTDPAIYGTTLRIYKPGTNKSTGGYITVTAANGYKINSITITNSDDKAGTIKYKVDNGTLSSDISLAKSGSSTVSDINASSVSFYNCGSDRLSIAGFSVTYTQTGSNPSISLSSSIINHTKAAVNDGSITVTYNNITSVDAELTYYESGGETTTTAEAYDWILAEINSTTKNVEYIIEANTGSKRTAYMKVHEKNSDVYSSLITITQASGIDTPTFDPATGTYTTAQNVTISCATENSTIYYTTNGNDPDNNSAEYTGPISITNTGTVLKAIAYTEEGHSEIASATYTIRPSQPNISYVGATVTITGGEGCTLYYTTNNNDPDDNSTEYTGPFDLDADCTIKAVAYDAYDNKGTIKSTNFKYLEFSPKNINSGYFEKVTDVSRLENGDAILIVYETENCAMSTTQNTSNRDKASVTISSTSPKSIYAPTSSVQKLVLVKNTESISDVETDVFYFYTGSGYLYAAGASSSNSLKTSPMPDDNNNSRATISISSENENATIAFQGTSTRNYMRFNNSNDQKKFSCYASNSSFPLVQIYKEVENKTSATISSAEYATFVSSYATDFTGTGIKAYTATDKGSYVKLNKISSGQVPANTPVVLYKEGADGTAIDVPVIASAEPVDDNDLAVVTTEGGMEGVANMFVLSKPAGKEVGFYAWKVGATLNKGKVYLQGKATSARDFLGFNEGNTTAIDNVVVKTVDANAPMYNLAGQRVNKSYKGVVIVNGKKMLKK